MGRSSNDQTRQLLSSDNRNISFEYPAKVMVRPSSCPLSLSQAVLVYLDNIFSQNRP